MIVAINIVISSIFIPIVLRYYTAEVVQASLIQYMIIIFEYTVNSIFQD